MIIENRCFGGDCKWRKQGAKCVHCVHPDAVNYKALSKPCAYCKRPPYLKEGGCGECIGRGTYIYPNGYDECDCGGYEKANA